MNKPKIEKEVEGEKRGEQSKLPTPTQQGLNWEKIPRTPNGQIELQYETFGSVKKEELEINEFLCIGIKDEYPFVTTEYCQEKAMRRGCKEIKTCECYQEQKKLEKKHPEINWDEPHKNPKEQIIRIKFIKKGVILNDRGGNLNEKN